VQCSYTFHFIDERLVVPKRLRLYNIRQPALYHMARPEFAEKDRTPVGPLFIPQSVAKVTFRLVLTKASRERKYGSSAGTVRASYFFIESCPKNDGSLLFRKVCRVIHVPYCVLSHPRRGNSLASGSDDHTSEDETDCHGTSRYNI
jgi:hypothetical protein